jgi:hypothetical protein
MSKSKNLNKSPFSKVGGKIALGLIIAVMVTVPIGLAFATASSQSPAQTDMTATPIGAASSNTQFNVHIAYAYVAPAPSNASTYFDQTINTTMHLATQYPSVVRLNINCVPGVQIAGCDAVVEVYGINIVTNTGPAENHAYLVGTNYNSSFSNDSQSTLVQYAAELVNKSLYSTIAGNFKLNWNGNNTPLLTNSIGSITTYTNVPSALSSALGLFSAGKPNALSVSVHRIGYATITNGSVSLFEDPPNSTPIDTEQLNSYGNGFLYNDILPPNQLQQADLFHPITNP